MLAVVIACSLAVVPAPAAERHHARKPHAGALAKKRAAKVRARRRLAAELRRHPRSVLKPAFMRKAAAVGLALPVTVRLTSDDDRLTFTPSTDAYAWPGPPRAGLMAPASGVAQEVAVSGSFGMQLEFGADASGYGVLGALETSQGQFAMLDIGPVTLFGDSACPVGMQTAPERFVPDALSYGVIDLVRARISGSLKLRSSLTAREAGPDCSLTTVVPVDPALPVPSRPIPVPYEGTARISPARTADGKLRIGVIDIGAPAPPQDSAFSFLRVCREASTCDPSPDASLDPSANSAYDRFPFRVGVQRITAELLLGIQA